MSRTTPVSFCVSAIMGTFAHLWSQCVPKGIPDPLLGLRLLAADHRSVVHPAADGRSVVELHSRRGALAVRVGDAELVVRFIWRPGELWIAHRIPGQGATIGQTITLGEHTVDQLCRVRFRYRGERNRAVERLDALEASIIRGELSEPNCARDREDRHIVIVPRAPVGI